MTPHSNRPCRRLCPCFFKTSWNSYPVFLYFLNVILPFCWCLLPRVFQCSDLFSYFLSLCLSSWLFSPLLFRMHFVLCFPSSLQYVVPSCLLYICLPSLVWTPVDTRDPFSISHNYHLPPVRAILGWWKLKLHLFAFFPPSYFSMNFFHQSCGCGCFSYYLVPANNNTILRKCYAFWI